MKNKILLLMVFATVALVVLYSKENEEKESDFEMWKKNFGFQYASSFEDSYRERIFMKNLEKIREHNSDPSRTYDKGLTRFSGLTQKEFESIYLTLRVPQDTAQTQDIQNSGQENEEDLKGASVDWIAKGAVTPIKDQGACGSCWAFSAVGGLQGLSKIQGGQLQSFSQSQLVDCSSKYGNVGCSGGYTLNALNYVKDHGIVTEEEYPYKIPQKSCLIDKGDFKIKGHVSEKTCTLVANALQSRPISVAVDATTWGDYIAGIFSGGGCGQYHNHAVLIVGMTDDYWHVKNSWGIHWGERGYLRLKKGNTCGICLHGIYPIK